MRTLFCVTLLLLGMACGNQLTSSKKYIKDTQWLVGTWEMQTSRGSIYETWIQTNKQEFSGKSYALNGKDTMVFENIQLLQEGDSLFYIPAVKNQNEGLPVRFQMTSISATEMIFENPAHDFPQKISYSSLGKDSLIAEISGTVKGELRKQQFPMRKVENQ